MFDRRVWLWRELRRGLVTDAWSWRRSWSWSRTELGRAIYVPQPKLERRRGYLRDYSGRGGGGSALAGRAAGTQQVQLARGSPVPDTVH